jgi:hypothetical protein
MQCTLCHHDFVISAFDCLCRLEEAFRFVFGGEEAFVVSALHLGGASHDRVQFGVYLSSVLHVTSCILLHHICKALYAAIHKGE